MRPQWAEYEALAHRIVTELAPHADVTHDDHILGRESEARRQIDISVRWRDGQSQNLLIIQVKDYKRRADVNVVGEFRSVVQDVGAQRGVLICSGGFSKNATAYARNIGLQLWTLADANSKKWRQELTVPVLWNKYLPDVHFYADLKPRVDNVVNSAIMTRDGDRDVPFNLAAFFEEAWRSSRSKWEPEVQHVVPIEHYLFVQGTRTNGEIEITPLADARVEYKVTRQSYIAQVQPTEYRGIMDHLEDGIFIPSQLYLTVPSLTNEGAWARIANPARVAVNLRGMFATIEDARIELAGFGRPEVIGMRPADQC